MFGLIMAQDDSVIKLPAPQLKGGKLLMQALKERQSIRSYSAKPLPLQTLSDLLWAADGINRPESGKRTAPTAMNQQELDIYVVLADGVYLYEPKEHALQSVVKGDFRKLCGKQDFVAGAPVNLILIADFKKMGNLDDEKKRYFAAIDAGYISQNVYLFCASAGLAGVARASVDQEALAKTIRLRPEQKFILAHTVGFPAE
jgi:SagB-type dehydrogenase family enzyme